MKNNFQETWDFTEYISKLNQQKNNINENKIKNQEYLKKLNNVNQLFIESVERLQNNFFINKEIFINFKIKNENLIKKLDFFVNEIKNINQKNDLNDLQTIKHNYKLLKKQYQDLNLKFSNELLFQREIINKEKNNIQNISNTFEINETVRIPEKFKEQISTQIINLKKKIDIKRNFYEQLKNRNQNLKENYIQSLKILNTIKMF